MGTFLSDMASGPRIIAVTGHFGSGKSEFTVSLAFALRAYGVRNVAVCDLDIENPYFRSREAQEALEKAGVRVYSDPFGGRNGSELQVISASVRAPLEDPDCLTLVDCGGDAAGARILNQFKAQLKTEHRLLCVVNKNRPGTTTPEKAAGHIERIESATGLTVTGLISNAHLILETRPEDVLEGWEFTKRVEALTGKRALCACCRQELCASLEGRLPELFPIGMYLRASYLDKRVR